MFTALNGDGIPSPSIVHHQRPNLLAIVFPLHTQLLADNCINKEVQNLLANQDALVAKAWEDTKCDAQKVVEAQRHLVLQAQCKAQEAFNLEWATAQHLQAKAEAAAAESHRLLQEELHILQAEHDDLRAKVSTSAAIVPESADSILANLRCYNETICRVITAPTPPVTTVVTTPPSTSILTATVPIFSVASTSEITDPSAAKRLKLDGNKFFPNGQKKSLSPFTGAEFQGLIMQNQITPNIRKQIAKDQYFKLAKMFKSDEVVSTVISAPPSGTAGVTVTATTTNANTGKEPTTKADIFYLLYQFGQNQSRCPKLISMLIKRLIPRTL